MCKLLTVTKKNNSQDKLITEILLSQEKIVKKEPDGISALLVDMNNKVSTKKHISDYDSVLGWAYRGIKNSKIISIHSRTATSGTVNEKNLHFFEIEGYYFAHNGIIVDEAKYQDEKLWGGAPHYWYKYGRKDEPILISKNEEDTKAKKGEMCDSYRFLCDIKKPLSKNIIENAMGKNCFYGIGIIIDSNKDILYTFGTRYIALHTDFKNYSISYSFDPENIVRRKTNFMGFDIELGKEFNQKLNKETVPSGVYQYKF